MLVALVHHVEAEHNLNMFAQNAAVPCLGQGKHATIACCHRSVSCTVSSGVLQQLSLKCSQNTHAHSLTGSYQQLCYPFAAYF